MRGVVTGSDFVTAASRYIGTPYVWGGTSPRGFDCSGLVEYVLTRMGLHGVPRTSEQQWRWATKVQPAQLQAGDLVFLNFPGEVSPGHVMIYAGANQVIQAPAAGQRVQFSYFSPLPKGSHEWGAKIVGYGRVPGLDYSGETAGPDSGRISLERLWTEAGGPKQSARIMAAIALAESGGRVDAVHRDQNGTEDLGLWQINSSHGYDSARLTSDPLYNARAAVSVFHSQGLTAWSTYTDGAYKKHMGDAGQATVPDGFTGRTRPSADSGGGSASGGGGSSQAASDAAAAAQSDLWASYITEADTAPAQAAGADVQTASFTGDVAGFALPGIPNPFSLFNDAQQAVNDVGTFLKWIAWLFDPRNILRVIEFTVGGGLIVLGLVFMRDSRGGESSSGGPTGVRRATFKRAVRATPPGRAVALAQASQRGKKRARIQRSAEVSKGHSEEERRVEKRAQRREAARRHAGESRSAARARRRREAEENRVPF